MTKRLAILLLSLGLVHGSIKPCFAHGNDPAFYLLGHILDFLTIDQWIDITKVKVGDQVGGLTIESIRPSDTRKPLGPNNARIQFKGSLKVVGFYEHKVSKAGGMASQTTTFKPSRSSWKELPKIMNDSRKINHILLQNSGSYENYSTTTTIHIVEYRIDSAPNGVNFAYISEHPMLWVKK